MTPFEKAFQKLEKKAKKFGFKLTWKLGWKPGMDPANHIHYYVYNRGILITRFDRLDEVRSWLDSLGKKKR